MRRRKNQTKKTFFLLAFLVLIGIGTAYAVLTEQLTINNTVSYDAMKWEVGFSNTEDNGGTITSTSSIKNEGKSITVNCDFGKSTTQQSCIVKATITNNGTFDIGLASDPIITYDDTYIHTLTFKWEDHPTYLNSTVLERGFVEKGTSQNVILTIKTKNLTKDMLPSEGISIPVTITLDFEEWQEDKLPTTADLAILMESGCYYDIAEDEAFCEENSLGSIFANGSEAIRTITFEDKIDLTKASSEEDVLDISASQNDSVMLVVVYNEEKSKDEEPYFELYIQSDTQLYANENMEMWFGGLAHLEKISGLELLDTSMTTNMSYMFLGTSYFSSSEFNLDLSNFDTSNVTNMAGMFAYTGGTSPNYKLNISNFDTSNVSNMFAMFYGSGVSSQKLELDLSNFNTSNVKNMSTMFRLAGYHSQEVKIDISNFNTSKVNDMSSMFESTGYSSTLFSLDVSNFNTSQVTNMSRMFCETASNSKLFSLNLNNFDTGVVTDMSNMFYNTGYNSTQFITTITIRNANVTSYGSMFQFVATQGNSQITVNYTAETSDLVDRMIATKSEGSNVVKGIQVD